MKGGVYTMGSTIPFGQDPDVLTVVYLNNCLTVPAHMSLASIKFQMQHVFPEIRAMEPYIKGNEIHFRHPSERESYRKAAAKVEEEVEELKEKRKIEKQLNIEKEITKKHTDLGFVFVYVAKTKTVHQLYTGDLTKDEIYAACAKFDPEHSEIKVRSNYITDASRENRTSLYVVEHGDYTFMSDIGSRIEKIWEKEIGLDGQWVVASGSAMKKCGTAGGMIPHARIKCVQVLKELDLAIVQLHYSSGEISEPMLVDASELQLKIR